MHTIHKMFTYIREYSPIYSSMEIGTVDPYDGRPRAVGNVIESGDRHVFDLHSLFEAPLVPNLVVKREQLFGISGSGRAKVKLITYVSVLQEIVNVPADAFAGLAD